MSAQSSIIRVLIVLSVISPTALGGNDTGPTAFELAVMALADRALTIFADVCKGVTLHSIS